MAMWCGTLRGDDIQQATAELKSQRAATRARYEYEMKQFETKIADLETLEHHVVNFVSNFKVEDESSATISNLGPAAEKVTREIAIEQDSSTSSETPVARPNLTLLNASDNSSLVSEDNSSLVSEDKSSRVWTPAERALLTRKQA
jgi:hypothetical protein